MVHCGDGRPFRALWRGQLVFKRPWEESVTYQKRPASGARDSREFIGDGSSSPREL